MPNFKFTFKKVIFIGFLSIALVFAPVQTHKASALWGEFPAQIFKMGLDTIIKMIQGVILGAAKQKAAQSLNSSISSLIGGSSTQGAMFITDWTDYLVTTPATNTSTYINDYLSQITQGRGSSSGYEGVGGSGSYAQQLVTDAKSVTTETTTPTTSYEGDPSQNLFDEGNFDNMNLLFSDVSFRPIFIANGTVEYQKKLAQEQAIATAKSIAYAGFKGTEQSGMITNPGSLVMQNMANVQDIGNKVLANAQNIPEVITSIVQQMITSSIQNGIGQVQSAVQKEVTNVTNQATSELNSQASSYGPGALYNNVTGSSSH